MSEKAIDYFISYPKSGRTWVRFMYMTYLELHFDLVNKNIFDSESELIYYWQPQWIHCGTAPEEQSPFYAIGSLNFAHLRTCNCIWMARNIYDTLVSLYYHCLYRDNINYKGSISDFIRHPKYGILKICTFYRAIYEQLFNRSEKVLKISYEEMMQDRSFILLKILGYVGLTPNDKYVKIAVEKSSFENMQNAGNSYAYKKTFLAPTDIKNKDSYKVRKAESGNFKDELSKKDIGYIDNVINIILPNEKERVTKWN